MPYLVALALGFAAGWVAYTLATLDRRTRIMSSQMNDLLDQIQTTATTIAGELDGVAAEIRSLAQRLGTEPVTQAMLDKAGAIASSLTAASARLQTMTVDPAPAAPAAPSTPPTA